LQFESIKNNSKGSKTPNGAFCKPLVSSSSKRSKFEVQKADSEISEGLYWSCNKILEEADEESVNNLTPRLREDKEREANLLEESQNMHLRRSENHHPNKAIYASQTTLETEDTFANKYEELSDSFVIEKRELENPLSLSVLSGGISNDDKYVSPSASTPSSQVPALNFSKMRKSLGFTSLNTSCASTTYQSISDAKYEKSFNDSPECGFVQKSLTEILYSGSGSKPSHIKNKLSHGKPVSNRTLIRGLKVPHDLKKTLVKDSTPIATETKDYWKKSRTSEKKNGFKGNHWDFNKKENSSKTRKTLENLH
jgi:hypothetical protein